MPLILPPTKDKAIIDIDTSRDQPTSNFCMTCEFGENKHHAGPMVFKVGDGSINACEGAEIQPNERFSMKNTTLTGKKFDGEGSKL